MSAEQFIEGVLQGVKIAEVDPTLQWGMLGAGVGGAGGLVKSLASGKSLKDVLKSTLGGAALGGGVGLSGAAGASILGARPPQVAGALTPKKEYKGDFSSSAGMGLLGAGGLLAGAHVEEQRDRGESLRKFLEGGGTSKDLFGGADEAALQPSAKLRQYLADALEDEYKTNGTVPEQDIPQRVEKTLAQMLRSENADVAMGDQVLDAARGEMRGASSKPSSFSESLTGKSPMTKKFTEFLEGIAARGKAPEHRVMAERILDKIKGAKSVLTQSERFAPSPRGTQFLKNFKGPKGVRNLALAAGGIGLGTYGLSGLGEKIWGKKE